MDKSNEIINEIVNLVVTQLESGWKSAQVFFDFSEPGVVSANGSYVVGDIKKSLAVPGKANWMMMEVRNLMKKGDTLWKKAILNVGADGKFGIDFEW